MYIYISQYRPVAVLVSRAASRSNLSSTKSPSFADGRMSPALSISSSSVIKVEGGGVGVGGDVNVFFTYGWGGVILDDACTAGGGGRAVCEEDEVWGRGRDPSSPCHLNG
jgi:hypothetical protein